MKKDLTRLATFILCLFSLWSYAQEFEGQKNLLLFSDRDYCVSGDTLWFKVYVPFSEKKYGNVVHVQLDSGNGSLINSVAKKCNDGCAEGFLEVPDSLSTGLYFLSSFLNAQRSDKEMETVGRNLFVYNRFDEDITQLEAPGLEEYVQVKKENTGNISVHETSFKCREAVKGNIYLPEELVFAVVKAGMYDSFASENSGFLKQKLKNNGCSVPVMAETDGVLLSGKIHEADGTPGSKELVLFSVPGELPHFDYYFTGKDGNFHFFLKNAVGNANVIFQTANAEDKNYKFSPQKRYLKPEKTIDVQNKYLNPLQQKFIEDCQNTYFMGRLFKNSSISEDTCFSNKSAGDVPFYGKAHSRVEPADFLDLPDFREISRELLAGVQYRNKGDRYTFRVLNSSEDKFFEEPPFVLLNGIPVFRNSHISSLSSKDIHHIDVVQEQRIYGDLLFNGVLAISLKDQSNSWLIKQNNIFSETILCLQPPKKIAYVEEQIIAKHAPDMRQNFMFKQLDAKGKSEFSFQLSDMKGKVQIVMEGLTKSGELFRTSKIIEVK